MRKRKRRRPCEDGPECKYFKLAKSTPGGGAYLQHILEFDHGETDGEQSTKRQRKACKPKWEGGRRLDGSTKARRQKGAKAAADARSKAARAALVRMGGGISVVGGGPFAVGSTGSDVKGKGKRNSTAKAKAKGSASMTAAASAKTGRRRKGKREVIEILLSDSDED